MLVTNNKNQSYQKIIANFTGNVRHDKLQGRDCLVAPMVMMKEGVLNGSRGPIFYSEKEIKKFPGAWNSKPVVVYHPQLNGKGVSACDPDILSTRGIGMMMNTRWEDNKLKSEAWFYEDQTRKVDDRVMGAVENNKVMELSTGLYVENDGIPGEFDGTEFIGSAKNFQPDHLALLPDIKGACSIDDGAGFLLNSKNGTVVIKGLSDEQKKFIEENSEEVNHKLSGLINNQMSHENIRSLINLELRSRFNDDMDIWVDTVYDNFFIYEKDGDLLKQDYRIIDNEIELLGEIIEVVRVTEFRTKDGNFIGNRKGQSMDKKKVVDDLIANKHTNWTENDRTALMAMNEVILDKLGPIGNEEEVAAATKKATEEAAATATAKTEATATAKTTEAVAKTEESVQTENMLAEEYLKKGDIPSEIKEVLQNALAVQNKAKDEMIKALTANEDCVFTEEFLKTKDLEELTNMCQLAGVDKADQSPITRFNYIGQGGGPSVAVDNVANEKPLGLPVYTS